jgi:broad-specificity NMP kinase
MLENKIIVGFPGIGKTMYELKHKANKEIEIIDLESSFFDKSNFPQNYISKIKELIDNNKKSYYHILISSHDVVRKEIKKYPELLKQCIIVYPDKCLKEEFLKRYKNRGNTQDFIKILDKMFEQWIEEIELDNDFSKIKIEKENDFLSNII